MVHFDVRYVFEWRWGPKCCRARGSLPASTPFFLTGLFFYYCFSSVFLNFFTSFYYLTNSFSNRASSSYILIVLV